MINHPYPYLHSLFTIHSSTYGTRQDILFAWSKKSDVRAKHGFPKPSLAPAEKGNVGWICVNRLQEFLIQGAHGSF